MAVALKKNFKRLNIGFIIDWLEDPYHQQLISGINDEASIYGVNLITYIGGTISSNNPIERFRNVVYQLIDKNHIDGLIIALGNIGSFSSRQEKIAFCNQFSGIPLVLLSEQLDNIPAVMADNESGLKELILHLINYHKVERIAYVKGPDDNIEACSRFSAYRDALAQSNIPYKEELVVTSHFLFNCGMKAVSILLDERSLSLQAIAACNDDSARGVITALSRRGIKVPQDIRVIGFDDDPASATFNPPLSTVSQPIYETGTIAVRQILELINGNTIDTKTVLPTKIVIRDSCGCQSFKIIKFDKNRLPVLYTNPASMKKEIIDAVIAELSSEQVTLVPYIAKTIDAFVNAFTGKNENLFLDELKSLLNKLNSTYMITHLWENISEKIHIRINHTLADREESVFYENMMFNANRLFVFCLNKQYEFSDLVKNRENFFLMHNSQGIITIADQKSLLEFLEQELSLFGLKSFYLCLYENDEKKQYSSVSRLIFAYCQGRSIAIDADGILFPSFQLLPLAMVPVQDNYSFYIEPLFYGQSNLGFAVIEHTNSNDIIYKMIRHFFINMIIKGALFVQQSKNDISKYKEEIEDKAKALSDAVNVLSQVYVERQAIEDEALKLNNELETRVSEQIAPLRMMISNLENTVGSLKNAQDRIIENEKFSSLNKLVAGVGHEINTPLGVSITGISHLALLTGDLMEKFNSNQLKSSEFKQFLFSAKELIDIIHSNLKKGSDIVNTFKQIMADQSQFEKRRFNLKSYIKEILLSLNTVLQKANHTIEVVCDDSIEIETFPGAFYQIVSNLVSNSLIHGFEKINNGKILIQFTRQETQLLFNYRDNGKGIDPGHIKSVFDPFFTTSRKRGCIGLGLSIVYNIITRTLGGTIVCNSTNSMGVEFLIALPLN